MSLRAIGNEGEDEDLRWRRWNEQKGQIKSSAKFFLLCQTSSWNKIARVSLSTQVSAVLTKKSIDSQSVCLSFVHESKEMRRWRSWRVASLGCVIATSSLYPLKLLMQSRRDALSFCTILSPQHHYQTFFSPPPIPTCFLICNGWLVLL